MGSRFNRNPNRQSLSAPHRKEYHSMAYQAKYVKLVRPSAFSHPFPFSGLSEQQKAACEAVSNGTGHKVIEAVAGAGKTASLVHALDSYKEAHPEHSILFIGFNVETKNAGAKQIPLWAADVKTCHGVGYGTAVFRSANTEANRAYSVVNHPKWGDGKASNLLITGSDGEHQTKFFAAKVQVPTDKESKKNSDVRELCRLVGLAKTTLTAGRDNIKKLATQYGFEFSEYTSLDQAGQWAEECMAWNAKGPGLGKARKPGRTARGQQAQMVEKRAITFDDQLWLPIVNGWELPKYDLVMVDECQDLSPARRKLVLMSLKPGGRVVAVGDRYQAIYGFAGASVDSLPELIKELDAEVLPMTFTRRCAASIVAEAQNVDPNIKIEAIPEAAEGIVDELDIKAILDTVRPGDVIISRTNAPLVSLFFKLAKSGQKSVMLGKDFASQLVYRIKAWKSQASDEGIEFDGNYMLAANSAAFEMYCDKLGESNAAQKDKARDMMEIVAALCEDLPLDSTDTPETVIDRLYKSFAQDNAKEEKGCVVLSSTHKFKGAERDRVFLLIETYSPGNSKSGRDGEGQEESNLLYVGITRARKHLTYVTGVKGNREAA